mgnify:CR=1 FL=1
MIDDIIFNLEANLGKPHTISPFASHKISKPQEEEKKKEEAKIVQEAPIIQTKEETKQEIQNKKGEQKAAGKKENKKQGGKAVAETKEESKVDEVWELFKKCDLRVGKIVECEEHPNSEHLYKEKIDVGEGFLRDIGSGLKGFIPIDEMKKGEIIVFVNLEPRKMIDFMSNGMVMCASNSDHTVVELMRPPLGSKVGERV